MSQARLLQLVAIRAQIDALIAAEGGDVGQAVDPGACPNCGAPESEQRDTSTFGHERRLCRRCKVERDIEPGDGG